MSMNELQGRHSAYDHSRAIRRWIRTDDHSRTYRQFLQFSDDLAAVSASGRVQLTSEPPESTDSRWDDAIAGLVELRLNDCGLSLPAWVSASVGDPGSRWEPQRSSLPLTYSSDPSLVPAPFLRRGVLIEAGELESV